MNEYYNLTPIHKEILRIYKSFAEICNESKLRFTIAYGTALGAIRHNGFIPWDDDFDVHMPRPDYEKFKKIANQKLPKGLLLVSSDNCSDYMLPFAKLHCIDKNIVDEVEVKSGLKCAQGLFIDIFPVDGVSETFWGGIANKIGALIVASLYRFLFRKKSSKVIAKLSWLIGWLVHKYYHEIQTFSDFNKWYFSFSTSFDKCSRCGRLHEILGKYIWILPVESFINPRFVLFEGEVVPIPADYKSYLEQNYGDYMTLPPESERKPTHGCDVQSSWRFGDGVVIHDRTIT